MGILDDLRSRAEAVRSGIAGEIGRYKNRPFMLAVANACALVAAADGHVDPSERAKMGKFIKSSDELKVFDVGDVIKAFNDASEKFEFDFDIGMAECLKIVGAIRKDPGAARLLVRVCCAIGAADGNFDADERKMVVAICGELGLQSSEFGL
jgi:tellurite resistance protein TerB